MKALIKIDTENVKSRIQPELFGSFVEHMGRNVYGGVYDPEHPLSDEQGFRKDVMEAVKGLRPAVVRYPGGNFVSGYCWKDGIGPKSGRSAKLDFAWKQLEPNTFGTDDFLSWCEKVGTQPLMTVNMGTGSVLEAGELVEYCNHDGGGKWAEERRKNGREKPYGVRYWCIGNEMDGPWQTGALSAEDYARKAVEAIKIMKIVDPGIKVVVSGDSGARYPTFPEWDRKVLELTYYYADFISVHSFFDYNPSHELKDFMASAVALERYLDSIVATCDYVKAYKRSPKTMMISLDEWNVWHKSPEDWKGERWTVGAERLENQYDFADALVVATLLCTLVNRSDRVKLACYAQLVNVIAPIFTQTGGGMFRQTIYHPIALFARHAAGAAAIGTVSEIPTYASEQYGEAPCIHHCVCTDESGAVTVFAVNVSEEEAELTVDFYGREAECFSHIALRGELGRKNSFSSPDAVCPQEVAVDGEKRTGQTFRMPGHSFSILKFRF